MTERKTNINIQKIVNYWIETSDEDYTTMLTLFESKTYGWALFLGHITLEKVLKAYFVQKHKNHAPFTHNLYRLVELNEIEISDEYSDWLDKITAFNLNARYDDYKREFYSICTKDFTTEWINKIKILRTWIKKML